MVNEIADSGVKGFFSEGPYLRNQMIFGKKENKEREIVQAITDAFLNSALDLNAFLKDTVRIIAQRFPAECAEIRLIDGRNPHLLVGQSVYVVGREEKETEEKLGKINHHINDSLIGDIYKKGEAFLFDEQLDAPAKKDQRVDKDALEKYLKFLPSKGFRNLIIVPLYFQTSSQERKKLGCLQITNKMNAKGRFTVKGFSDEDKNCLERIASKISVALKSGILYWDEQETIRIKKIIDSIPSTYLLTEILEKIQEWLCDFLECKISTVWSYEEQTNKFVLRDLRGLRPKDVPSKILEKSKCIIGRILKSKEPIHILDITEEEAYAWSDITEKLGSKQLVAAPFVTPKGEVIGVIVLHPADDVIVTGQDIEIVKSFAEKATNSIEYARLRWRDLQLSRLVDHLVTFDTDNMEDFFENVVELIAKIVEAKACSLFMINEKTKMLKLIGTTDRAQRKMIGVDIYKQGEGIIGKIAATGKPFISYDIVNEPDYSPTFVEEIGEDHHAMIGVPITDRTNKVIGVLKCVNRKSTAVTPAEYFTTEDLDLLILIATLTSKFIESAELINKVKEMDKLRDEYIQSLAHETLAPVTGIMGHAEYLLNNPKVSAETKRLKLLDILDECHLLDVLVKGPKDLEERKEDYKLENVDICQDALFPCIKQLEGFAKSQRLKIRWSGFYRRFVFKLDKAKFYQIVFNILHNAIKYSYWNNEIFVHLEKEDDAYRIDFKNFGIGVEVRDSGKIFERYYRTERAKSKHPTGKGLGLYIVKTICKNLEIEIKLTQQENPTIFSLYLPKSLQKGGVD